MTQRRRHAEYKAAWGRSPRGQFSYQRKSAGVRGIEWRLTFEQWLEIWGDKLAQRGRTAGKLVMARNADTGPYAVGNVNIITTEANLSERKTPRGSAHGMAKLTEGCVDRIRDMLRYGCTQRAIAEYFGVVRTTIGWIARGKHWSLT